MAIVEIIHIKKTFGESNSTIHALVDIDLKIDSGEFIVIMGPSGAGKSTLISLMGALDDPTSGKIFIKGKEITSFNDSQKCDFRKKNLGIIFQFFSLHPNLTVSQNVELPLMLANIPKKDREKRISHVLELTYMTHRKHHFPDELSGGEQQRVAISRSLVLDPIIILADEPTGNLDFDNAQSVIDLLHELNTTKRQTVLVVTHDHTLLRSGDRVIQMEDGKIIDDKIMDQKDIQ